MYAASLWATAPLPYRPPTPMSAPAQILDFVLHMDTHLGAMIVTYGPWFWGVLFLLLFAETGLVVTPFLPGDSLLFAAGALIAGGRGPGVWWIFLLFVSAVFLGDTVNYWIGHSIGHRMLVKSGRILSPARVDRTRAFFARYGSKSIVLARFVPFVRTFAPFLAGVGQMEYGRFITYNALGGTAWVGLFLFGGYLFGGIPAVKNNLALVLLAVIVITAIPIAIEYFRQKRTPVADTPGDVVG